MKHVPILLLAATAVLTLALPAGAAAPWHAPGWAERAVVEVIEAGTGGVDTAAVRIRHAGAARVDGRDLRVFDVSGRTVPWHLAYHAPRRESLVLFRAPESKGTFYVYLGKADGSADPYATRVDARPGSGPPAPGPKADGWIPRAGLVLTTLRRPPDAANPETVEQMAQLIAASPGPDGAGLRRNIRDGINPFSDSDHFISVYRGWLRLPKAGTWGFCTASNEASFSFLDGKPLVHWPGRHTEQRGKYGQKQTETDATAGLHYVEYYHEEVLLYQVAFLGWRPPGAPHYVGIPDDAFPRSHRAVVRRYEAKGGAAVPVPHLDLVDSLWPRQRPAGQYTRYRFAAGPAEEAGPLAKWSFRWEFGDGLAAENYRAEHVYLATGTYEVHLRAVGPDGRRVERTWPLAVYPIEHLAEGEGFENGSPDAYRPIVSAYDAKRLDVRGVAEQMWFFSEFGSPDEEGHGAETLLAREDATPAAQRQAHLILAGTGSAKDAWRAVPGADARGHLDAALRLSETPRERLRVMARLIRHLGVDEGDVTAAEAAYLDAETLAKGQPLAGPLKAAFRDATLAIGDAHLAAGRLEKAGEDYRTAEALADPVIPPQIRVAKIGAYPERLEQLLAGGKRDEARQVVGEWYAQAPSDILRGEMLFWMGKVELARGQAAGMIRPLRLAIDLGQGAAFEAEARWLLAEAYGKTGDAEGRRAALAGLVRSGLAGPFREKAIAALEKLGQR